MGNSDTPTKDQNNKIWLDYDQAKCLIKTKQFEKARIFAISVLKKKQNESWAWGALAATYRPHDPESAIKLFAQGISFAHDEKFAIKLIRNLALLLAKKNLNKEASICVKRAINIYNNNSWKLPDNINNLQNQPWYIDEVNLDSYKKLIETMKVGALDYLFGTTSRAIGLVINVHKSGKGCDVYIKEGVNIPVPFFRFSGKKPKVSNYVEIRYMEQEGELNVVSALLTAPCDLNGVQQISGVFKMNDKGFGFVGDTFIPPHIASLELSDQNVEVLRYRNIDKLKKQLSWKAATIKLI